MDVILFQYDRLLSRNRESLLFCGLYLDNVTYNPSFNLQCPGEENIRQDEHESND